MSLLNKIKAAGQSLNSPEKVMGEDNYILLQERIYSLLNTTENVLLYQDKMQRYSKNLRQKNALQHTSETLHPKHKDSFNIDTHNDVSGIILANCNEVSNWVMVTFSGIHFEIKGSNLHSLVIKAYDNDIRLKQDAYKVLYDKIFNHIFDKLNDALGGMCVEDRKELNFLNWMRTTMFCSRDSFKVNKTPSVNIYVRHTVLEKGTWNNNVSDYTYESERDIHFWADILGIDANDVRRMKDDLMIGKERHQVFDISEYNDNVNTIRITVNDRLTIKFKNKQKQQEFIKRYRLDEVGDDSNSYEHSRHRHWFKLVRL